MKKITSFVIICVIIAACSKKTDIQNESGFTKYTIRKGQNSSDENRFFSIEYAELKFVAKFDSTAIYKTADPSNQSDINKLYGFSDNNSQHQDFSARFGWRWSDNALRIFGFVHNNGLIISKELGSVSIGSENNYTIKVTPRRYVFLLNGITDSLPRASATILAKGYKLYPFFGGDEPAPQNIYISIKEL
jgi:hypothetical protein